MYDRGRLTAEKARAMAAITPVSLNAMESVYGGLMFIMAETAAGLLRRSDGRHVTVNSSFRFLKGAGGGRKYWQRAKLLFMH